MKRSLAFALLWLCLLLLPNTPAAVAQQVQQIMFLGDSITKGAVDPNPSQSGFRARVFDLLNEAHAKYLFVGCTDNNSNAAMKTAGQQFHNGYGTWRIDGLRANLEGSQQPDGDANLGGFWMSGGTGALRQPVFPDLVLILAGTNDLGQGTPEPVLESRMTDLLTWFQTRRPKSRVFIATVPPRGLDKPGFETYNPAVVAFNAWLTRKVPTLGGNFRLVDFHAMFVDATGQVKMKDSPDGIFLQDGIHPSHNGYVAMGNAWFQAIKPFLNLTRWPAAADQR